jgi:hypothetical protein
LGGRGPSEPSGTSGGEGPSAGASGWKTTWPLTAAATTTAKGQRGCLMTRTTMHKRTEVQATQVASTERTGPRALPRPHPARRRPSISFPLRPPWPLAAGPRRFGQAGLAGSRILRVARRPAPPATCTASCRLEGRSVATGNGPRWRARRLCCAGPAWCLCGVCRAGCTRWHARSPGCRRPCPSPLRRDATCHGNPCKQPMQYTYSWRVKTNAHVGQQEWESLAAKDVRAQLLVARAIHVKSHQQTDSQTSGSAYAMEPPKRMPLQRQRRIPCGLSNFCGT